MSRAFGFVISFLCTVVLIILLVPIALRRALWDAIDVAWWWTGKISRQGNADTLVWLKRVTGHESRSAEE